MTTAVLSAPSPSRYARAALAVLRRDVAVYISYRTRPLSHFFGAAVAVATFHFISRMVHVKMFASSDAFFGFAVVGFITLEVLTSSLNTPPGAVRQELVAGTFERLVLSPFGAVNTVLSMMVFPLMYSLLSATFTLIVAAAVFGMPLQWATVPLAVPAAMLGALSFMPFGVAIAAFTLAFKRGQSAVSYVVQGVGIVAGFYFPIQLLPAWIRWTSDIQPFTPSVDLIRHLLVGTPLIVSPWVEVARLLAFSAVLMPISIMLLSAAIQFGRRRGTIIEY